MVIETNITKMFGIKHPILNAPMGPYFTNDIAIGISEAGGLGVASHTGGMEGRSAIGDTKYALNYISEHTDKPFGFNIRTSRMEVAADNMIRRIPDMIMKSPKLREQVLYVVTSAGSSKRIYSKNFIKLKETTNIKHFHVAPALWLADKCVATGVDGLCLTGSEGGGHQSYEKVSTLVLLQQVRQKYPDMPIVACGGFGTGEGLAAVVGMGGGGVVMGTRFIASHESEFDNNYKELIPPAKAGDTRLVTGMLGPIRLWKNRYCMSKSLVGSKEEKLAEEKKMANMSFDDIQKNLSPYAGYHDMDIQDLAVLLGQSAGLVNTITSVKEIMDDVMSVAEKSLKNAYASIK